MYFLQNVNVLIVLFQMMPKHINNVFREDSQINFAVRGGVTRESFSHSSNNRFFQEEKLWENLVSKEECYMQHTFKLLFELGKFGVRNYISD